MGVKVGYVLKVCGRFTDVVKEVRGEAVGYVVYGLRVGSVCFNSNISLGCCDCCRKGIVVRLRDLVG